MTKTTFRIVTLLLAAFAAGCSRNALPEQTAETSSRAIIDASSLLLAEEPAGARDVIAARSEFQHEEPVVVVGRIGGSRNPWVDQRAAFSIVDTSLVPCNEREGDDCPVPWDYCCDTDKLPSSIALVKFVDKDGQLLAAGARELFAVKELQTVVVRGTAQRDDAGNLTILADGLYIRN